MIFDPVTGLSDQRYFHVALLSRRKKELSPKWILNALREESPISAGRLPSLTVGTTRLEFHTISESPSFAGSPESVRRLAAPEQPDKCDYDIFVGGTDALVIIGSGYASLTRALARRLVARRILKLGWFLRPKMEAIVALFRSRSQGIAPQDQRLEVELSATGLTAVYPGGKNFRGLRFGGADVFGEGLMETIEGWLSRGVGSGDAVKGLLTYKMIRIQATGRMTGNSASITLVPDGSYKVWLRKACNNLPDFAAAASALSTLSLLEERAEPPAWAEDEEL